MKILGHFQLWQLARAMLSLALLVDAAIKSEAAFHELSDALGDRRS